MTENYISQDSDARKRMPMAAGLLDYFPAALAAVAEHSHRGNQKHNPGQDVHWARGKSMDHADCIVRHLIERGGFDPEGGRHSAALAWRALALLQEELEAEGAAPGRGSRFPETENDWMRGDQWELTPKAHEALKVNMIPKIRYEGELPAASKKKKPKRAVPKPVRKRK